MNKYTSPVSYFWGGICTVFGALDLNKVALIIGIVTTVLTFFINWVYKRRDFIHKKELREQHYAKYKKDNDGCGL